MCITASQLHYATMYPKFYITRDHEEYDTDDGCEYKFKSLGGNYHDNSKEIDYEEDEGYQTQSYVY